MNKKLIFSCLSAVLLTMIGLFLLFMPVSKMAIQYYLKTIAQRNLNADIEYRDIYYSDGHWVVEDLRLSQEQKEILTVHSMQLDYEIELLKANIHLEAVFIHPSISLGELVLSPYAARSSSSTELSLPKFGLFTVSGNLMVDEGVIAMQTSKDDALYFQLKGDWSASPNFYLRTWQKNGRGDRNQLSIMFTGREGQNVIEVELKSFDCQLASQMIDVVWPSLNHWKATSGVLSGRLVDRWISGSKQIVNGELHLSQVDFHHAVLNLSGNLPQAHLLLHDSGGELKLPKPLTLKYSSQVDNKSLVLSGNLLLSAQQPIKIALEGQLSDQGRSYPLQLSGQFHPLFNEASKQIADLFFVTHYRDLPISITTEVIQSLDGVELRGKISSFSDQVTFVSQIDVDSMTPKDSEKDISWLLGMTDFHIKSGGFKGEQLPLSQYHELFTSFPVEVGGMLNIEGAFDENSLIATYTLTDFSMENPFFLFSAKSLDSAAGTAVHYYNFKTGELGGVIPFVKGVFLDKNTGSSIDDIKTELFVGKNGLFATQVEAYWEGLFLLGALEIQTSALQQVETNIHIQALNGKFSQIQHLLTHLLNQKNFPRLPLEGEFMLRTDGAGLKLLKQPNAPIEVEAYLHGALIDGQLLHTHEGIAFQELSCHIDYDFKADALEIQDLQGTLLVGSEKEIGEYQFAGDYIRFSQLSESPLAEFDLWMGDKNRDFIRIAGRTENNNQGKIAFHLDPKISHIGEVHPEEFQLILNDWSHVYASRLKFQLNLNHFSEHLPLFNLLVQKIFSKNLLEKFTAELKPLSGILTVQLDYDDSSAIFAYQANGKQIGWDDQKISEFDLKGSKKDDAWVIDRLKLDQLVASADLSVSDRVLNINFLSLQIEDLLLLALEGKYFPSANRLEANLKLFELKFNAADQWPLLARFKEQFKPQGNIKGTGKLKIDGGSDWHWAADLNTHWQNWSVKELQFSDAQNVRCHISSDTGIVVQGLKSGLKDQNNTQLAAFEIQKLSYDYKQHQTLLSGLSIDIPKNQLKQVAELLKDQVYPSCASIFCKTSEWLSSDLKGTINLTADSRHHHLNFTLAPNRYELCGRPYQIRDFLLEADPLEIRITANLEYETIPWQLEYRSSLSELASSSLVCHNPLTQPLYLYWHRDTDGNIVIQKMEGSCPGFEFNLLTSPEQQLGGTIAVFPEAAKWAFPADIKNLIETLSIGGQFVFKGKWSLFEPWRFLGTLESKDCLLGEYFIERISGNLQADANQVICENLSFNDIAGSVSVKEMILNHDLFNGWQFQIPLMTGSQLRPGYLRKSKTDAKNLSDGTFTIKKMQLEDVKGNLNQLKQLQGQGYADCVNPPRRNQPNQIWNISSDTLSQFGLNTSLLSPVTGTVYYHLADGRIYLDQFKEMHSAAKLSKFYLPQEPKSPYFVDFDGNLHLQIRLKHHSLFMKLAQLFIISIDGTIDKPIYSLAKQIEDDN